MFIKTTVESPVFVHFWYSTLSQIKVYIQPRLSVECVHNTPKLVVRLAWTWLAWRDYSALSKSL